MAHGLAKVKKEELGLIAQAFRDQQAEAFNRPFAKPTGLGNDMATAVRDQQAEAFNRPFAKPTGLGNGVPDRRLTTVPSHGLSQIPTTAPVDPLTTTGAPASPSVGLSLTPTADQTLPPQAVGLASQPTSRGPIFRDPFSTSQTIRTVNGQTIVSGGAPQLRTPFDPTTFSGTPEQLVEANRSIEAYNRSLIDLRGVNLGRQTNIEGAIPLQQSQAGLAEARAGEVAGLAESTRGLREAQTGLAQRPDLRTFDVQVPTGIVDPLTGIQNTVRQQRFFNTATGEVIDPLEPSPRVTSQSIVELYNTLSLSNRSVVDKYFSDRMKL